MSSVKVFVRVFFFLAASLLLLLLVQPSVLKVPCVYVSPAHAQAAVDKAVAQQLNLKVNGVTYTFTLTSLEPSAVHSVARAFCLQQQQPTGEEVRDEEELEECASAVLGSLLYEADQAFSASTSASASVSATVSAFASVASEALAEAAAALEASEASATSAVLEAPISTSIYQVVVPVMDG
jgi:hypothetical protein